MIIEEYFSDRGGLVQRDDIVRLVEGGQTTDLDALPYSILESFYVFKSN
jgi:hypothetical protein